MPTTIKEIRLPWSRCHVFLAMCVFFLGHKTLHAATIPCTPNTYSAINEGHNFTFASPNWQLPKIGQGTVTFTVSSPDLPIHDIDCLFSPIPGVAGGTAGGAPEDNLWTTIAGGNNTQSVVWQGPLSKFTALQCYYTPNPTLANGSVAGTSYDVRITIDGINKILLIEVKESTATTYLPLYVFNNPTNFPNNAAYFLLSSATSTLHYTNIAVGPVLWDELGNALRLVTTAIAMLNNVATAADAQAITYDADTILKLGNALQTANNNFATAYPAVAANIQPLHNAGTTHPSVLTLNNAWASFIQKYPPKPAAAITTTNTPSQNTASIAQTRANTVPNTATATGTSITAVQVMQMPSPTTRSSGTPATTTPTPAPTRQASANQTVTTSATLVATLTTANKAVTDYTTTLSQSTDKTKKATAKTKADTLTKALQAANNALTGNAAAIALAGSAYSAVTPHPSIAALNTAVAKKK